MQVAGIHHLTIEGDRGEGLRHLGRARTLLDRLQNRMRLGGTQTGADMERVSERVLIDVRVAMGVSTVTIAVGAAPQDEELVEVEVYVPDFLSGLVVGGFTQDGTLYAGAGPNGEPNGFCPTAATQRAFDLGSGLQASKRLAMDGHPGIPFATDGAQCMGVVPTLYSGSMTKLVQLVLGYGRPGETSRYSKKLLLPRSQVPASAETPLTQLHVKRSKADGYRVQYDWRPYRTHGLTRAQDGRLWVVEVSWLLGVIARPLPLFQASTTAAFRERMEQDGEREALAVLDAFGGFPTGEAFPESIFEFEGLERAGQVIRLLDAAALESAGLLIPNSDAHGWAFSESGRLADYHGQRIDDDTQLGVMEHHRIAVSIGSSRERTATPERAALAARVLAAAKHIMPEYAAAVAAEKCYWMTDAQANSLAGAGDVSAAIDAHEMTVSPVASGSASTQVVSSHQYGLWSTAGYTEGSISNTYGHVVYHSHKKAWQPDGDHLESRLYPRGEGAIDTEESKVYESSAASFYDGEQSIFARFLGRGRQETPSDPYNDGYEISPPPWSSSITFGEVVEFGCAVSVDRPDFFEKTAGDVFGSIVREVAVSTEQLEGIDGNGDPYTYTRFTSSVMASSYDCGGLEDVACCLTLPAFMREAFSVSQVWPQNLDPTNTTGSWTEKVDVKPWGIFGLYPKIQDPSSETATAGERGRTFASVLVFGDKNHVALREHSAQVELSGAGSGLTGRRDQGTGEHLANRKQWMAATKNCLGPTRALIYHAAPTLLEDAANGYDERREVMEVEGSLGFSVQLPAKGSLCFIGVV